MEFSDGHARVVLGGCLDTFVVINAFRLQCILQPETLGEVVVDATEVSYIDSAVLGTLVGWAEMVRAHDGTFTIRSASAVVDRLCALVGLDRHLEPVAP